LLILVWPFCGALPAAGAARAPALNEGFGWDGRSERLHFDIRWWFLTVGHAVIQARPLADFDQVEFRIEVCSTPFVDRFYKIRDLVTARAGLKQGRLQSRRYRLRQRGGDDREDLLVIFAPPRGAVLHDFRKQTRRSYATPRGAMDVVSAFFATRAARLRVGDTVRLPIFDKDKGYVLEVETVHRENAGSVLGADQPLLLIEPRLKSDGFFRRSGQIRIWLSADGQHLPVALEAKARFGTIRAELQAVIREEAAPLKGKGFACEAAGYSSTARHGNTLFKAGGDDP
jgi:hypothetical protein